MSRDLLIRNVEIGAEKGLDVLLRDGTIADIGKLSAAGAEILEGDGGALLPGLHDHHIHLLALATERQSIQVGPAHTPDRMAFENRLRTAAQVMHGQSLRATQYHESVAGPLDRVVLDLVLPDTPLRVQYRTGSLWVLNSAALRLVQPEGAWPDCVELDNAGHATGRIWRGDAWLRSRLKSSPPDLAPLGQELARLGITGVTDTSVTTTAEEAAIFDAAVASGALPQRLLLMSGEALPPSDSKAYRIGAVKILLDEHKLGDITPMTEKIKQAHQWQRNVAVHCVTATELAFALAAFDETGTQAGDRIEHGGVIDDDALMMIRRLGLAVVTQPSFVAERGDTYLDEVEPVDQPYLYRCASLLASGVPLAASSDAPYASPDPWKAIMAAAERRTPSGMALGLAERISRREALDLFLRDAEMLSHIRRIERGERADFCLLRRPLHEALQKPDKEQVAATIIAGELIYRA